MTQRILLACLLSLLLSPAQAITPVVVAEGLHHPWAVAFLPGGDFLVSERSGALRVVDRQGRIGAPIEGLPAIASGGQGGLLDVVLDSAFARNRQLYFCFSEPAAQGPGNSTALASATLSADRRRLEQVRILFSQQPKIRSDLHFGCRIVESRTPQGIPDGQLFLTLGERYSQSQDAQTLDNHHGKVIRISKDGSVPRDNPFVGVQGARPEIWSYGHRNPQGAALAPDGTLWIHEHGPRGGDEINLPRAGGNYGWPRVSFGQNYNLTPVGEGKTALAGTEPPLHYWTPSIAPSGMTFVSTDKYGKDWRGNLLVGALKLTHLARLELARPFAGKVVRETRLLSELGERIRDVREAPDGFIYVLTDSPRGKLIRLQPLSN